MSHFYASIQGNRGEATRCGTKSSGIDGHVRGWDSGIKVLGTYPSHRDCFFVYQTTGSNNGGSDILLGILRDGVWEPAPQVEKKEA